MTAPSLSVCCMTADPPEQVAAMLGGLRRAADEIVVAADARVDPRLLDAYAGVADKVVRVEHRPPVDRPRAWLAAQCSGDWLLSIDGDEVPGADLVGALPDLVAATDVAQYWLPRRWLHPDPSTWLAEVPWWPDYQLRLVRNDATLAARAETHAGFVAVLPARHVAAPLYHLDCVVNDAATRTAKAGRYEAEHPGRVAYGGGSLNGVLYAPERWAAEEGRPVPAHDRPLIEAVLAARAAGLARAAALPQLADAALVASGPPVAPAAEIDALASSPAMGESDYRVGLTLADPPVGTGRPRVRLAPREVRPLYLTVENRGGVVWPWGLDRHPELRVSYHWRAPDGRITRYDGRRSALPCTIRPGESAIVPTWVEAPAERGDHVLEIDLVHEHVRWFDAPLLVDVVVADRPGPAAVPADPSTGPAGSSPPPADPSTGPAGSSPPPADPNDDRGAGDPVRAAVRPEGPSC